MYYAYVYVCAAYRNCYTRTLTRALTHTHTHKHSHTENQPIHCVCYYIHIYTPTHTYRNYTWKLKLNQNLNLTDNPIDRSMYRPIYTIYDVWHVMLSYLFHTCFNMNTYKLHICIICITDTQTQTQSDASCVSGNSDLVIALYVPIIDFWCICISEHQLPVLIIHIFIMYVCNLNKIYVILI